MNITINVPDQVGEEINNLKNRDDMEIQDLITMLEKYRDTIQKTSTLTEKKSKWSTIAEEIHNESPLHGLSREVNEASQEFRDHFYFKHDL
ncbi:MAG: hypothetical protein H7829_06255 [Magnetococcus sp. THC-1_WYH]